MVGRAEQHGTFQDGLICCKLSPPTIKTLRLLSFRKQDTIHSLLLDKNDHFSCNLSTSPITIIAGELNFVQNDSPVEFIVPNPIFSLE
jgi:hypothetical protein